MAYAESVVRVWIPRESGEVLPADTVRMSETKANSEALSYRCSGYKVKVLRVHVLKARQPGEHRKKIVPVLS